MRSHTIQIAQEFSRYPAGRYKSDGPYSGEACREGLLAPALKKYDRVIVELDGTLGYGSSFTEELFGGLVRASGFSANDLENRLEVRSADRSMLREIRSYISEAMSQRGEE